MTKSFFLTVFLSTLFLVSSFAQKREEEIKKLMWESDEPGFKVTDVPEKWKNESAVIICQSNYHEYRKEVYLLYLYQKEYLHKRIKLQDKSSVADFSEFSFPANPDYFFGIKIVKPSAKEIIVDLKDAVVMEKSATGYYGSSYNVKYKKIAIPALEVGDIIDYYICMERSIILSQSKIYTFSNVIYTLQDRFPILKQKLEFKLKRRCFLNIKEYNNAPELKVKEDPKDETTVYYMIDNDREKVSEKLWHFPYRSLPTIKFQVRYAAASGEWMYDFLGSPTVPKTYISKEEIIAYVNKTITGTSSYYRSLEEYLKKYYKTETDPEKFVQAAYDYYRLVYTRSLEGPYFYLFNNPEISFIKDMSSIMKKRKIPYQILISVPRNISTLDEAILETEFSFIIKVNTNNPFYLCPPSRHSLMKEIDPLLQGVEAYAINLAVSKLKNTAEKVKIPFVSHLENNSFQKSDIVINEDFTILKANVEVILKGKNKKADQNNLVNIFDYKDEENNFLKEKDEIENIKNKKEKEVYIKKKEREKEEYGQQREKALKENAEEEYDAKILSVINFNLKQAGRWSDKPEMIYTEEIEMEGLLKKVGQNYILEAGKLIGKQIEITEEDKKRKFDIYMPYARSFNNEITLQIPDGYAVEGIESLIMDKRNKTGGFVTTATVSGNKLIITTLKYYANNFEKAEDWSYLEEFLEAAYFFTQQKLLLKKI